MIRPFVVSWLLLSLAAAFSSFPAFAQPPKRTLDPTVLTTIASEPSQDEVYSGPRQLPGYIPPDFAPNSEPKSDILFERAKETVFVRKIWNLEFTFKPLRMVEVDIPQDNFKMQKKVIWYMVYKVSNKGNVIGPKVDFDPALPAETVAEVRALRTDVLNQLEKATLTNRFFPLFVLDGWVQNPSTKTYEKREYPDKLIPAAVNKIREIELLPPAKPMLRDEKGEFVLDHRGQPVIILNNIQISQVSIPLSDENDDNGVWGVCTWEDVNPAVDFVSIFVKGLTNAFEYTDVAGKRHFRHKVLQLNFWRPGDRIDVVRDSIRYGVPLVNDPVEQVKLFNLYQIPGPMISCYRVDDRNNHQTFVFAVDAAVDEQTLELTSRTSLDAGKVPPNVAEAFRANGIDLPPTVTLTQKVKSQWWEMSVNVDGQTKLFRLLYEPQHWDIAFKKVVVKRTLNHLWVYRNLPAPLDLD